MINYSFNSCSPKDLINMIRNLVICVIVFLSVSPIQAQNIFSGAINYTLFYSSDDDGRREVQPLTPAEQAMTDSVAKRASEMSNGRINSSKTNTMKYLSVFDKKETIIFWYDDSEKIFPCYYQSIKYKKLMSIEGTMSARYLVLDTMTAISWRLSKNTKKIHNIECFSAQAEYRGRVWTAWYAPSIPISSGPWKLYGLPGMILEAEDRSGFMKFECTKIIIPKPADIKNSGKEELLVDKKTKKISYKEYVKELQESLTNYDKMNTKTPGELLPRVNISNPEIFAFEEATGRRIQQKLADTPKK